MTVMHLVRSAFLLVPSGRDPVEQSLFEGRDCVLGVAGAVEIHWLEEGESDGGDLRLIDRYV